MRTFEGKNFYEILSLAPNADLDEVRQAHAETLEMYEESALATYALFSDEEREKLLGVIDQAFQTLADKQKRAAYDQMLISTGRVDAAMFSAPPRRPTPHEPPAPPVCNPGKPEDRPEKQATSERVSRLTDAIHNKSLISGADLRELREALDIDFPQIYAKTRISRAALERIEQDQYEDLPAEIFLRSFLKSYAEILRIEPKHIVEGYLKQKADTAAK